MIIVGHRGLAGHLPENTRISIEAAVRLGLEWIEVDIQPSKDDVLVVCHDHTVNRCSNGKGRVDELRLEELEQLNFAYLYPHCAPQKVMTLNELIVLATEHSIKLNLEVKVDRHSPKHVVELIARELDGFMGCKDIILFSSFSHDVVRHLRLTFPEHDIALLSNRLKKKDRELLAEIKAVGCNLNYRWATNQQVSALQSLGYKVWCFTVNNPNRIRHLKNLDGLFSDYPERFL